MSDRLVLVAAVAAGGVARHLRQVARAALHLGDEITLLAPAPTLAAVGELRGVDTMILAIGERPGRQDSDTVSQLREALRGADVVHAHGARAGAMSVLAARGLGRARPRVVVTLHNAVVGGVGTQAVSLVLDSVVANGADVVLTVSNDLLERERRLGSVRRGLGRVTGYRVTVERAVIPVERPEGESSAGGVAPVTSEIVHRRAQGVARFLLDVAPTVPFVVTIARLAPQKGLTTLLDAAGALVAPGAMWWIAGDGPLREDLEAMIAERGLQDRVRLLGRRADVGQLLRAADVVVSTAEWEGQPIAMMEALQAGAAIVATDAGGTSEVLDGAARLVPVGEAAQIAKVVDRLLADPLARTELQRLARHRARQLPTDQDLREQLRAVYARPSTNDRTARTDSGS